MTDPHPHQRSTEMDRRPLRSRGIPAFQHLAAALARARVSPNAISVFGMLAGIASGVALALTALPETNALAVRGLFLLAAGLIQLRLLCNMLDGMVAVEGNMRSPVGELYNEIPDRVSDTATLVGAGFALGGDPILGLAAAILAMFTAYIRAVGKAAGAGSDFRGPMAKPHRMFVMTVTCLFMALAPAAWRPAFPWWNQLTQTEATGISGLVTAALAIITLGSLLTALRRLLGIAAQLRTVSKLGGAP